MPGFLRKATASQGRALGPFLDDTDFKTPETGLTIANTDIKLVVNGAASVNKNANGGTHRANGVYGVTFDATDSATVGEMDVSVVVSGALPVFDKFFVLEAVVYDALFVSSAPGYGTAQTGDSYARIGAAGVGLTGITGAALSTAGIDAILDDTIGDGSITVRQALRVLIATQAGKTSGGASTTFTIRNVADSANVVVATVDADGNRSAVTVTP